MPPNNATLLIAQKVKQTQYFINIDPISIVINRVAVVTNTSGGRNVRAAPQLLAAQTCRLIPARTRSANQVFTTPAGQIVSTRDATLVGLANMNILVKDWFLWNNQAWQVTYIYPDRRFQTAAQLDIMGKTAQESI